MHLGCNPCSLAGRQVLLQGPCQFQGIVKSLIAIRFAARDHQHELALTLILINIHPLFDLCERAAQDRFELFRHFTAQCELCALAQQLNLTALRDQLPALLARAEGDEPSYSDFSLSLLRLEAHTRKSRRLTRNLKRSGLVEGGQRPRRL